MNFVLLNLGNGLPVELRRVLIRMDLRLGGAVKHRIEPVIPLQAFRRPILIGAEEDSYCKFSCDGEGSSVGWAVNSSLNLLILLMGVPYDYPNRSSDH
ncbi:MAG: hypothetical protein WAV07_08975, partial [Candidatus Contendobacter sp.]